MDLPIPAEPTQLKKLAQDILTQYPGALRATPHSGADPLAFVYGNRIPRFLWTDATWSTPLQAAGIKLEDFLRLAGNKRRHFIRWIKGEIPWMDYVGEMMRGLRI